MIAIPAIDLRGGACVQLVGGSFANEAVRIDDPSSAMVRWQSAGFTRLHVVDLDAAVGAGDNANQITSLLSATRIPIQVGATNGGADGSVFVSYGVLHVGLSWPGRYSHSPVEVLDLRDLNSLERLIYAIATSP